MERNPDDLIFRQKLIFAKSPFERMFHSKINDTKIETRLLIEAPSKVLIREPRSECNFPISDLSKLRIEAPSEREKLIKSAYEKIDDSQVSISEKCLPKEAIEVPKEDWEKLDVIKLENWHLQIDRNSSDITIIGYRSDIEELWLSDSVLTRIDEKKIMTKSKYFYQLIGMIDSSSQESKIISHKFVTGFPEDWKEIKIERY